MSMEENKAIIRRLVEEFWNKGNAGVIDEVFAPDFVDHSGLPGVAPGREGFKQFATMLRAAFSNPRTTVDDLIAEGDKVVWRWTFRGIHQGPLMGVPATGKEITFTGIVVDRMAGGKIVERCAQNDTLGMMQQLGVIPAAA